MKRKLLLICALFLWYGLLYGQSDWIVDMRYPGTPVYGNHTTHIKSTEQLPIAVNQNLTKKIRTIMGAFADSLTFTSGVKINIDALFATDTTLRDYVIPAYELNYRLSWKPIGIKNYYVKLELDRYGQLLSINWPRRHYTGPEKLAERETVQKIAIKQAVEGGYYTENHTADLTYKKTCDCLGWVIMFPQENRQGSYQAITISWLDAEIISEDTRLISRYE